MKVDPALAARAWSGVIAAAGLGVLGVARWLEPVAEGFGTHEQLGLAPCTFFWLSGVPCPMCGATTAWALMAELRLWEALRVQPFAVVLFVLHLAITSVAVAEVARPAGRWDRMLQWTQERDLAMSLIFLFGIFSGWTYKIARVFGFF